MSHKATLMSLSKQTFIEVDTVELQTIIGVLNRTNPNDIVAYVNPISLNNLDHGVLFACSVSCKDGCGITFRNMNSSQAIYILTSAMDNLSTVNLFRESDKMSHDEFLKWLLSNRQEESYNKLSTGDKL